MSLAHSLVDAEAILRARLRDAHAAAAAHPRSGKLAALLRATRLQDSQIRRFTTGGHLKPRSLDNLAKALGLRFSLDSADASHSRWAG